jgi:hypothetical protein
MATRDPSIQASATTRPQPGVAPSRIEAARARAASAKVAVGSGGIAAFGLAMLLAHASYAGQARHVKPLSAPPQFVATVRQDQLQAGILGPASAPAGAATSVS